MTARRTLALAGAIALTAALAACTGSPPTAATTATTATSHSLGGARTSASPTTAHATGKPASTPAAPRPVPHATEANPPGDIPDNQAFVPFSPPAGGYSVKIPEGWARVSGGTTTSFTDKLNSIQVSTASAATAPTAGSVIKSDVPRLRAKVPQFTPGTATSVTRTGGTAILLTYQGDSSPDPVTGKVVRDAFERYTFYRAGMRVDLTLSGPTNADNVDPWRIVSNSLRWL